MKRYIALCPRGVTIVGPVVFQGLLWVKPALCLLYLYREREQNLAMVVLTVDLKDCMGMEPMQL